ncbi:hypothetical protein [Azospirillum doebereinerae]
MRARRQGGSAGTSTALASTLYRFSPRYTG